MTRVPVLPLTAEAFAPYGEVLAPPDNGRLDHVATLGNGRADAKPNLFLARSGLLALPHAFSRLECHPHSSQSFAPWGPARIVLAVALRGGDGRPDPATLRGFLADNQGFSYRAGVWHLSVAALGQPAAVLGFMYEDGGPEDCVFADIEPSTLMLA